MLYGLPKAEHSSYWVRSGASLKTIPDSCFSRLSWNSSSACLNGSVAWKKAEKGLSIGRLHLERADSTGFEVYLVRISPLSFRFQILGEPGSGRFIEEWVRQAGGVAGINGGYFFIKDERSYFKAPLGWLVNNGQELSPFRKNYSGILYSSDEGPAWAYREKPLGKILFAIQSFPMLLSNGKIPEEVFRENGKLNIHRRSRRSAIGEDWEGRIIFLVTGNEISFRELSFLAGGLGFKHGMSLDGGASSQLAVFSRDTLVVRGVEQVPFGIGIFRK